MSSIMPAFRKFPDEGELIGRLLAGYGELEFDLCQCVANACGDFDHCLKAMFQKRGESRRIEEANNIGEPLFTAQKLRTPFSTAIDDMHYCRKIRNQFAHCHWHDDYTGRLGFVVLEEIAKDARPADLTNLTIHYVDPTLLSKHEAYFRYVGRCFAYLNGEGQVRVGTLDPHPWPKPQKIPRPPLHL